MDLKEKYGLEIAKITTHEKWVRSNAKRITDKKLAEELSDVLKFYILTRENSAGVSSNNIYWNRTDNPLRMIYVPDNKNYKKIIVMNPKFEKLNDEMYISLEACGSLTDDIYLVPRSPKIKLIGQDINFKKIEMIYDLLPSNYEPKIRAIGCGLMPQAVVQHEIDHLEGIVISDKGIKY